MRAREYKLERKKLKDHYLCNIIHMIHLYTYISDTNVCTTELLWLISTFSKVIRYRINPPKPPTNYK